MAKTWLSISVELLGGRGEDLWPAPGRIFAVGPSHTFHDLAEAINDAFARWDRSHLSEFTLADGTLITDPETGAEFAASDFGPLIASLDIESTKVARTVGLGDTFRFVFDLGDQWAHCCTVGTRKVDPVEELGIRPKTPLPYWGWGEIPDQYGRRWAEDDGEARVPRRPGRPHPMLWSGWPARDQIPPLDPTEVRAAIASGDAGRFLAAVTGHDPDDALQFVAAGIPAALAQRADEAAPLALSIVNRLNMRSAPGDRLLSDELLARLRGEPLFGEAVPVDLDWLSTILEGDPSFSSGGYLDLRTGDLYDESATDPGMVGEDVAIDPDEDPDRWLRIDRTGSRAGWDDMAAFAAKQRNTRLRARLEQAIEGAGAFRRFRDAVEQEGLGERWELFSTDRRIGRAREFLADHGLRVG